MNTLGKLFGGLKMTWLSVIIFALATGVLTGIVAVLPFTENTSFRDIAISYEWWLIFAFIIASNCSKFWESALKVFVFFLISQPLCYAIEVVICTLAPGITPNPLTVDMAIYYYTSIWGPMTLLTLPGGAIAFYITKQNVLGSVILGLGCAIQALLAFYYAVTMIQTPPHHLLTVVVCIVSIFVMAFTMQKDNKRRVIALAVAVTAAIIVGALFAVRNGTI